MNNLVTGLDLEIGAVTIDVPYGDLLAKAGAALARWQEEVGRLQKEMAGLQKAGIFLDEDGEPVVPGWWERKEKGQHIAWYLVWPQKYARRTGNKRRQYVKAADYKATRVKVERTLEYANLKATRDRLASQIEQVGQALAKLADRLGW